MKKFQTVNIINQEPTTKTDEPDNTTKLMQEAILLTIDVVKTKIKCSDSPKDVSLYVASIKTLTDCYNTLIS